MKISTKDWTNYISKLRKLSDTAADKMQQYVQKNGFADTDALIDFAHALVTKYGEGSAELACQMYDAIAEVEGASVAAAIPAETATYAETARAIHGSLLQSPSGQKLTQVASRLVKQAGADTTIQNAKRDSAWFAWVPSGDTCSYCLMIGAIGWQRAGSKTLKGNHASHIHAHCDCQYCVDFKGDMTISGYSPEKLQEQIMSSVPNAEEDYGSFEGFLRENARKSTKGGRSGLNALRRIDYSQNREKILAQKSAAYAVRTGNVENISRSKGLLNYDLQYFAKVPDGKLLNYVLDPEHPRGKNKARVFKSVLGYTKENYEDLKNKILENFNESELIFKGEDEYGQKFEQIMSIKGPNGKTADVTTGWIKDTPDSEPRLTSAYIKENS